MFNKLISIKPAALLLGLALIAGANYSAVAQKRGNGNGHGNGGEKHGGQGNRGSGEDRERGNRGQGNGGRAERQQQQQVQRQMPQQVYSNPGWNRSDRAERRQQQQVQRQMPQQVYSNPSWDRGDRGNKNGNGNGKRNRGNDQRTYQIYQPQVVYGGGWVPPGQIRSREVHERNDARKAWKNEQKEYKRWNRDNDREDRREARRGQYSAPQWWDQARRVYRNDDRYVDRNPRQYAPVYPYSGYAPRTNYAPRTSYNVPYNGGYLPYRSQTATNYGYDPYGYSNAYANNYYDNGYTNDYYDNGGTNWKSSLIRMLISGVLSGFGGGNDGYYDQNSYQPYTSGIPVRYAPAYANYGGYAPQYASYDQGYSPYGQGGYYEDQSNYGSLLGALPINDLFGGGNDLGGYMSDGLSQMLAQGYLQGLTAGDTARRNNYGDRYYNDPYVSDSGIYDQCSSTIGENRRLLSEGYSLGYEDALNGRGGYNSGSGGGLDLVNVLLSDVFNLG